MIENIKNIVLIANSFNPSVFSSKWLIDNSIIADSELDQNCIFTNQLVQVITEKFVLIVLPDQLQLRFIKETKELDVLEKLEKIITLLPHIPYKMMGVNFIYFKNTLDQSGEDLTKKYFYNSNQPIYQLFNAEDARFGIYLSKNVKNGLRLKLDIKPVDIESNGNYIQLSFNYHADLVADNSIQNIKEILKEWNQLHSESLQITDQLK